MKMSQFGDGGHPRRRAEAGRLYSLYRRPCLSATSSPRVAGRIPLARHLTSYSWTALCGRGRGTTSSARLRRTRRAKARKGKRIMKTGNRPESSPAASTSSELEQMVQMPSRCSALSLNAPHLQAASYHQPLPDFCDAERLRVVPAAPKDYVISVIIDNNLWTSTE
ncbi:uncharacterized protein SCHCODRAFT_02368684 [Schizophyllum commune H4-8]|uniref:uncharacterized protein n=1 Tax=Schizophyllum commune (strain H4-8 / FGSC 9210) TaxID=578458 RepID=UPI00216041F3|nr:uncharacterized protein SCHCODRAFT_02368684 [Schizophyllum commune H4-8]KAI5889480.1 hypothetical protein SCHCODRAFT_02368684 [Schizophyllum commune H4-8]